MNVAPLSYMKSYPLQLPSFIYTARTTDSYVVTTDEISNLISFNLIVSVLTASAGLVIYPIIAENIKSTASKKPKAYYQFWAAHVVILAVFIYTVESVTDYFSLYNFVFGFSILISISICVHLYIFSKERFNTPTQCCICHRYCKKGCSNLMTVASIYIILSQCLFICVYQHSHLSFSYTICTLPAL